MDEATSTPRRATPRAHRIEASYRDGDPDTAYCATCDRTLEPTPRGIGWKHTRSATRRAKGDGGIYPQVGPDGKVYYRGSIWTKDALGRRVRRYARGKSTQAVRDKLAAIKAGASGGVAGAKPQTLAEYLPSWLADLERGRVGRKVRGATVRGYAQHAARWVKLLGHERLDRLTPAQVTAALDSLVAQGLSARTVEHARATLRRALKDAQAKGLVSRNAAAEATGPEREQDPDASDRVLAPADALRLLDATEEDRFGPLFRVALGTGLRLGELLGLRWSDVESDILRVRRSLAQQADGSYDFGETKTRGSRRAVSLSEVAREGLAAQRDQQAEDRAKAGDAWRDLDLVFSDEVGGPLPPWRASKAFRSAADALGLTAVQFHDLRHSAASLMFAAGVPLRVVSETLGHSSIAITSAVYVHLVDDARREAAAGLDASLRGAREAGR